jgi:hypothetical protein
MLGTVDVGMGGVESNQGWAGGHLEGFELMMKTPRNCPPAASAANVPLLVAFLAPFSYLTFVIC